MPYKLVLGVDEAGYGPNLGPLVVAVSTWRIPVETTENQLVETLQSSFVAAPWNENATHVPLGDSKRIYTPNKGLKSLEIGVLAMMQQFVERKSCDEMTSLRHFTDLLGVKFPSSSETPEAYYHLGNLGVPANPEYRPAIATCAEIAKQALADSGVQLLSLTADIIAEDYFNTELDRLGSKGLLLSRQTLQLVTRALKEHPDAPTEIYCDRQGGRKDYLALLQDAMPNRWFQQTKSENYRSSYRSAESPPIDIHFTVGADSFPPAALASMLAKYLRERSMEALNTFWRQHLPDLKATAGYPVDAKRFAKQIQPMADKLKLPYSSWWRAK